MDAQDMAAAIRGALAPIVDDGHRRVFLFGSRADGFTLIEIALALLVVSVGLMAVFGLFPSGLGAVRAAQDEQRAAAFADDTFASLRTLALVDPWDEVGAASGALPAPLGHWGADVRAVPNAGTVRTVYFVADPADFVAPEYRPAATNADYALRYRLDVAPALPRTKIARLRVWPGEFGPESDADARIFVTEIFRGGLR